MIEITKLNEQQMIINCDLIECIESTPDTTITMTTGRRFIARESVDEIINRAIAYKTQRACIYCTHQKE